MLNSVADIVTTKSVSLVWAFDLGKASLGEAVRFGDEFLHTASWLIPEKLAQRGPATEAGSPASRYRAMKTREAHLAREARLRTICAEAGIDVLAAKRTERDPQTKKFRTVQEADEKLTREFPRKGDDTCYTSCLLRIKLLRGEPLAGWQVFKALHSAIQRRGYDAELAWKNRGRKKEEDEKDSGDTKKLADAFRAELEKIAPGISGFHLPCYLDASRMGLWNPAQPDAMRLRIDHLAGPARNRNGVPALVAPRDLVVAEARQLLEAAAKLFPKLAGRADEILFGPGGKAYASFYSNLRKAHGLRRGGAGDWDGILGQKVPRFDNRIIPKCALLPRLNACSAAPRQLADGTFAPESLLAAECTFLKKLHDASVQRGTGGIDQLTPAELRQLFESRHDEGPTNYSFTERQWERGLERLGLRPAPGHSEIAKPNLTGRSRFCRPVLRILRDLLLSGRTPLEQHALELEKLAGNTNTQRGLVPTDLAFLRRMGDSWTGLSVPDQQHVQLLTLRENEGRDAAIRALIGSCNNPIVRHRLEVFWKRLQALELGSKDNPAFGVPDEVVLEFVREDFMGPEAKQKLKDFQTKRAAARKLAREDALKLDSTGKGTALKLELLRAQGGECLYTGAQLAPTDVDSLVIEHIVPRGSPYFGPDAMVNYTVTKQMTNAEKRKRTPYQWFQDRGFPLWDVYVARVKKHATSLRAKKVRLLTEPDAAEQVQRYTALAETAYIARLAQTLTALYFNWPFGSQEGARRITIVNGGLTARVRRNYKLNSLLNPCPADKNPRDWEETCEKNRDDDRHHALDAMVISFIPGWARDPGKEGFFRLPKDITRDMFAAKLQATFARPLAYERSTLAETAYAGRIGEDGRPIITQRVKLLSLGYRSENMKQVFSVETAQKKTPDIRDSNIRQLVMTFVASDFDEAAWQKFCSEVRVTRPDGSPGARIKKISVYFAEPDEYKDLAKDGSGAWRKRFAEHRGQFIFLNSVGEAGACPVYAFDSAYQVRERLAAKGLTPLMFLQSGCLVQTTGVTAHARQPLLAGTFLLNSVRSNTDAQLRITKRSYVQLSLQDGTTYRAKPKPGQRSIPLYQLQTLLAAGFRRAD